jgi:ubiquinone/menaquinone biosynthesis C-methylase UbiE
MVEIDLDHLAHAYRLRPMSDEARSRALTSSIGCSGYLLDIGGGTGDHAATWLGDDQFPVVIDPSSGMLEKARRHRTVAVAQARSQNLPVRDGAAALAYFHLSIHYGDWEMAIDEAFRVVGAGGRIEVWTMGPEAIARSSLGQWFPDVVGIDTERFPNPELIAQRCRDAGSSVELIETSEPIEQPVGEWTEAVRGRFVSTLQYLDDREIDDGLARFTAKHPDPDSLYKYELGLTRISTIVRPLR